MVFSLPPMLFIIFWSADLLYEEGQFSEAVFEQLGELIGQEGVSQIMITLEGLAPIHPNWWTTIIGVVTLLLSVTTVFLTMQQALNRIFEVQIKRSVGKGIIMMFVDRFLSIAMLCVIGIILTISMILSTLITTFGETIEAWIGHSTNWLIFFEHIVLNLLILTFLFALAYRYIPDSKMNWNDTWFGAFFTAIMFIAGKSLIESSIGNSQAAEFYDVAGSILVLMLWVYYTSAIFLFGAYVVHCRSELYSYK
jgi:membrane protein